MSAYPQHHTLRELDEAAGVTKGSAFRVFKRLGNELQEGVDYRVLHHEVDRAALDNLKHADRIYRSSVNAVLLSAAAAQRIAAALCPRAITPQESGR